MKRVTIQISAQFGSKFQEYITRDSLMIILKTWKQFTQMTHKKNTVFIKINEQNINHLDWFSWQKDKQK